MADPVLTTVVLTEGVKFLYGQGGEILRRWRDRHDKMKVDASAGMGETESVDVRLPAIAFEGQLSSPEIHFDAVALAEEAIRGLRRDLSEYVDETLPIDPADTELVRWVDALRTLLEAVYQQRLTLKGEERPASGPVVGARIDVERVVGEVAAVRARRIIGGRVTGEARAGTVDAGGQLIGVDVDTIGG